MIKFDKITTTSLMLIVIGIDWFFGILNHPVGSKLYCGTGNGCKYMGTIFFTVGMLILIYRYKIRK